MRYASLTDFLKRQRPALARGPVAIVLAEDAVEVGSTLRHHREAGFRELLLLAPQDLILPAEVEAGVHRIDHDVFAEAALTDAINPLIDAAPGSWMFYCYNAEYLFHPFRETRTIGDLIAFHSEERRDALVTYVIDLYAADLGRHPGAVSLEEAMFDRTGYYALDRPDPLHPGRSKDRQVDVYGGLRWRFEEHVPPTRRRIDRVALFRAQPGLRLRPDHTFTIEEYNTYACAWHHNITATVCSFRAAKALKRNPGSASAIPCFRWHGSEPFRWQSQQLMDLGLMEPGQWF